MSISKSKCVNRKFYWTLDHDRSYGIKKDSIKVESFFLLLLIFINNFYSGPLLVPVTFPY